MISPLELFSVALAMLDSRALYALMPKYKNTQPLSSALRVAQLRKCFAAVVMAAETTYLPVIVADMATSDNLIVFANDAFAVLTGLERSAILSEPLDTLIRKISHPFSPPSVGAAANSFFSEGSQLGCRHTDGNAFSVSVFSCPLRDESGQISYCAYVYVTADGPARTLNDRRNEFYALYDQAPGFIAMAEGPDHRFTFANASYKKFVGRSDLVGKTVGEAMPEISDQGFVTILDEVYRSGEPFVGRDISMGIADPVTGTITPRYCDFVYQAVRDVSGSITGLFCEGYDVTEQHKTTEALAELQAELIHVSRVHAMGTMATTLAHELNQPLSAIANYAVGARRLLDTAEEPNGSLLDALRGIDEAARRASDIIRNLRELTRRRESAHAPFDLKSAVSESIRLILVTTNDIDIVDDIPPGMTMAADRVQIQQVVINLLRNACDAVSSSPVRRVSVSAAEQGDNLIVSIKDTGSGVPVEVARNLFSWIKSSKDGGMGLGLPISQTIMEVHRGRIWLEHSSPQGSIFCFSVPLAQL